MMPKLQKIKHVLFTACLLTCLAAPEVSLAAEGDLRWTKSYNSGAAQADWGWAIVVDSSNNIYVAGYQGTNGYDMFLRKYNSLGILQWAQTYNSGATQMDQGQGVAIDSAGNVYVTGNQGTNGNDMFLRKYNSAGTFQWAQTYDSGAAQADYGQGVVVDPSGNIYVTGFQATNGFDMFLRKYDSGGNFQWMQTYNSGAVQLDRGQGVALDSAGNIYVTGFQATNGYDMFLRKYDSAGTFQWAQTYNSGAAQSDYGEEIVLDPAGNIYIAGSQQTNGYDMFLRKYDSGGNFQWMQTYNSGAAQADYGQGVALDPVGSIYVTGLQQTNGFDMFLRKYNPLGILQWAQTYNSNGTQDDRGQGVAVDADYNIDITGVSNTAATNYDVMVWQYAGTNTTYLDCGVRMHDGTSIRSILCETPLNSRLRIQRGGVPYSIKLVDPTAADASRFRVQTPAGVKALARYGSWVNTGAYNGCSPPPGVCTYAGGTWYVPAAYSPCFVGQTYCGCQSSTCSYSCSPPTPYFYECR